MWYLKPDSDDVSPERHAIVVAQTKEWIQTLAYETSIPDIVEGKHSDVRPSTVNRALVSGALRLLVHAIVSVEKGQIIN